MEIQKKDSTILFMATGQGCSIIIRGQRKDNGPWKCSIEENEITYTDTPKGDYVASLGEKQRHEKTEFTYLFEEAFKKIEHTEWFLYHPDKLHTDITGFVMEEFDKKMAAFNSEFPPQTPMEEFIRSNKTKEWKTKTGTNDPPQKM